MTLKLWVTDQKLISGEAKMFDSNSFSVQSFNDKSFDFGEKPTENRVKYTRPKTSYTFGVVTRGYGGVRIAKGDRDAV